MTRGKVVMVGAPPINAMLDGVETELNHRGHAFVRYANAAEFRAAKAPLAEGDVLVALGMPVTRGLMAAAKLRAVVSPFTGTEHIDVAAATEAGIVVGFGQTPENTIGMAESTIMLMLVSLYDLHRAEKLLRESQPRPPQFARLARGKTVGLIGLGAIGKAIAQRLAGWEARVVAYTPRPRDVPGNVEILGLDELLAASDVIMVVASFNAETENMMNRERLLKMKKDAVLITTSRGGIVDEAALAEVAAGGHLSRVALDVYETEPLPADSPLRGLPNAVLTPHIVGQTRESWQTLPATVVQNVVRPMENKPPLYVRNPEVLASWQKLWGAG